MKQARVYSFVAGSIFRLTKSFVPNPPLIRRLEVVLVPENITETSLYPKLLLSGKLFTVHDQKSEIPEFYLFLQSVF